MNSTKPRELNEIDAQVRRKLLRPFARRRGAANRTALIVALERLQERALGEHLLSQLRGVIAEVRHERRGDRRKDADRAAKMVDVARALYAAGRISTQEFVLHIAVPIEGIHNGRIQDGRYDDELKPINATIDEVRARHGLAADEDWVRGEGPAEYNRLNEQYEAVLHKGFAETLRDFGLEDLAILYERDRQEFERLRERGRRSTFHSDELAAVIRDTVIRYEEDARKAAAARAYSAAVTLLGAGLEGLLILRCLRSKAKAVRTMQQLPKRLRQPKDDPAQWSFEVLIRVCQSAGWLRRVETPTIIYDSAGLADSLRSIRNLVHPGRQARERPWLEIDARDFEMAEAIYSVLLHTLGHVRPGSSSRRSATPKHRLPPNASYGGQS